MVYFHPLDAVEFLRFSRRDCDQGLCSLMWVFAVCTLASPVLLHRLDGLPEMWPDSKVLSVSSGDVSLDDLLNVAQKFKSLKRITIKRDKAIISSSLLEHKHSAGVWNCFRYARRCCSLIISSLLKLVEGKHFLLLFKHVFFSYKCKKLIWLIDYRMWPDVTSV